MTSFDARSNPATYDSIGRGYANHRLPDPRIAARIWHGLGEAKRVCNVGAGAGSYEPVDRAVVAVEPSRAMIAQRAPGTAVVRAAAEALPFADQSFDAAMALMTVHHWHDVARGLRELRRIAPLRVLFVFDPTGSMDQWLVRDYLPQIHALELNRAPRIEWLVEQLGRATVEVVPVPWDCTDGFQAAYWRRPERYLDPQVRASISTLAVLPDEIVDPAMTRLADDLASGRWAERNSELLSEPERDYAYRLIVSRD